MEEEIYSITFFAISSIAFIFLCLVSVQKKSVTCAQLMVKNGRVQMSCIWPIPGSERVSLPRCVINKMNRAQLEEHERKHGGSGIVTRAERDELKRIRRLIVNREYARQSRERRRAREDYLQKQLDTIWEENHRLRLEVDYLKSVAAKDVTPQSTSIEIAPSSFMLPAPLSSPPLPLLACPKILLL